MAVVTVAGVIVFFAAHRGREIDAHMIGTDAPGYLPPPPAPGRPRKNQECQRAPER